MECMLFLCRMPVRGSLAVFLVLFVSLCAEQEENEVHSDTQQNTAQVAFRGLHAFILICTTFTSQIVD